LESTDSSTYNLKDKAGFEQVFRMYYSGLKSYANKMLKDDDQADEVVQEIFFKLWEKRNEVAIGTSLKSYLFRSVHNTCLNLFKHQKVRDNYKTHVESRPDEWQWDESDSMVATDIKEKILEGISLLPEQCGRIFRMNRLEGYKYREIAEELGISPKTVEGQMSKALRRMREHLKDYIPLCLLLYLIG